MYVCMDRGRPLWRYLWDRAFQLGLGEGPIGIVGPMIVACTLSKMTIIVLFRDGFSRNINTMLINLWLKTIVLTFFSHDLFWPQKSLYPRPLPFPLSGFFYPTQILQWRLSNSISCHRCPKHDTCPECTVRVYLFVMTMMKVGMSLFFEMYAYLMETQKIMSKIIRKGMRSRTIWEDRENNCLWKCPTKKINAVMTSTTSPITIHKIHMK